MRVPRPYGNEVYMLMFLEAIIMQPTPSNWNICWICGGEVYEEMKGVPI